MNKPCATCPFLECNRGKPTPTDHNSVKQNQTDWYSQENMDGIWRNIRLDPIMFLSCHSTDPGYYGKEGGQMWGCVGATLLLYMHIKIYDVYADRDFNRYIDLVGQDTAMRKLAMGEKMLALAAGKSSVFWGGMNLAREFNIDLNSIRWPTGSERAVQLFKEILNGNK